MSVRRHPSIPGAWVVDIYPHGRQGKRERIVHPGPEAAARQYELELRRQYRGTSIIIAPKLVDALPDFLDYYRNNRAPRSFGDLQDALKRLLPHFGNKLFTQLTPALVEQYKAARLATVWKGKPITRRTINRELSYLSALCTWAAETGWCNPLPFKIRKFPKVVAKKPIIPSRHDIEALVSAADPAFLPVLLLLYDAGLRKTEALRLRAEDVHLGQGYLRIFGKGGKEAHVPITTDRLRAALSAQMAGVGEGWLFANPKTGQPLQDIRKALARTAAAAGITGKLYPHLLRHSFGTHALSAGLNLRAIQGIMRHADSKTTELYTHLLGDYLRAEADKFRDYISPPKPPQEPETKKKKKPST